MKFKSKIKMVALVTVWHKSAKTGKTTYIQRDKKNVWTDSGRDAILNAMYVDTVATQKGFNYIAISTSSSAVSASNTTLASEITGNGLDRVLATNRTHSAGLSLVTISTIFTATAPQSGVWKAALFDSASVGIMAHINLFAAAIDLSTDDELGITWSLTYSE